MRIGIELLFMDKGNPDMACPLMRRTNDPDKSQKQIRLRYAAIGAGYGRAEGGHAEPEIEFSLSSFHEFVQNVTSERTGVSSRETANKDGRQFS
jgi:hypothetical protein